MNPDEKYMSQGNLDNTDIEFVPPLFINKEFRNDATNNVNNNFNLDLFSSETGFPELYYCGSDPDDIINRNNSIDTSDYAIPTTFDVLRSLDLDLDETEDIERVHSDNDVNKIYSKIEKRYPGIFASLYSYRIPRPIVRVIVKRLIRLTLSDCDRENNY